MKVVRSFETFGYVKLPTTLYNVPEDQNHQCQCCENIKCHNKVLDCQLCWIVGKCVQVLCEAGWAVCDSITNAASKESPSQLNCCKLSVFTEHGVMLNLP